MVVDSRNDDFLLMPVPPEIAKDIHLTPSAVPNGAMDGTLLPNDGAVTAGRDDSGCFFVAHLLPIWCFPGLSSGFFRQNHLFPWYLSF